MILAMIMTLTLNPNPNHNPHHILIVFFFYINLPSLLISQRYHYFPQKALQTQLTEPFLHITKHFPLHYGVSSQLTSVAHPHTLNCPMTHIMNPPTYLIEPSLHS